MSIPSTTTLERVYGDAAGEAAERLATLEARYHELFGTGEPEFFSAPGRTEIIGNHTDHNGGKILAASITMDTICAAAPSGNDVVTIVSEGYPEPVVIDLDALDELPHCAGTLSLVAGMLEAFGQRGHVVGGFDAVVSTQVISSAGVSSSASFEMLLCAVVNHLFNDDAIDVATYALVGQYAENVWWEKASGLMDQMACAVGGTIVLDFSDGVRYERVDFSYDQLDCDLVIVNTGKGHADLSAEYSSVPGEMRAVAAALGAERLCDTSEEALLAHLDEVRSAVGCDRALMRALHYFEECGRVDEAVAALAAGDKDRVLALIEASGSSSWRWLQNAYVTGDAAEQSIPLALALTELYLKRVGGGACRLHGGGFAGVIMCAVPKDATAGYVELMSKHFGAGNVYLTNIRATGAVCLGR
jgi:galactokinase